jgi:predicted nucleic acid-binding protein
VIYLDANLIIRWIEGVEAIRQPIQHRLQPAAGAKPPYFLTSRLCLLECRCKPMRDGNAKLLALYDNLFRTPELRIVEIDALVIDEATRLRATYGFKSPDAIHVASAIVEGAGAFLTGDQQLKRCTELNVELI